MQIYLYILFTTYGNLKCQSNRPLKYPHFVTNFELKILLHFVLQTFLAEFWDQILPSSIFGGTECLLTFFSWLLKPFYGTNYVNYQHFEPRRVASSTPPLLERFLSLAAPSRSWKSLRLRFLTHELNSLSNRSDGQCFDLSDDKMLLWKGFFTHTSRDGGANCTVMINTEF